MQIHSVPAQASPGWPCQAVTCPPLRRLRPYVLGYSGFRAGSGVTVGRRFLPLNLATVIIDFAGRPGLVSGPRSTHALYQQAGWRHGVAIGLTPAGVSGLLGLPMPDLAGGTALLDDLLGRRAAELAERLAESPDWATRFAVLDERLSAWLAPDERLDKRVMYAWSRLQNPVDRITIQGLAGELGISRRHLETGFRRHIGLPPKTVARIARFQHALGELSSPSASLAMAATYGYADQSHFSREVRAMSGMTPSALFAFVQDAAQVTG